MKRAVIIGILITLGAGVAIWQSQVLAPKSASRTPHSASRTPHPASRLNVLLITIDTLRADRVGRGLTPFIDGLAKRGTTYGSIRATAPLTLPSHVSLMTGATPPAHGVRENGVVFDRKTPTLARIFKNGGYQTSAFVGAYVLNRRFGLDEGFDTYDDGVRRDAARVEQLEAERPGGEVVDAALRWLPSPSTSFFMWVHLYDPHAPYTPPPEYLQRAGGNAYDGEVAYVDAQVGRLLEGLEARGLTDTTIVAVTGDHGEGLGEHGEQTHGMLVYDSTLRVPLIVAAPGVERFSDEPCHSSVAPGLLRMAGLASRIPKGMSSESCAPYSETHYPRRAGWHALTSTSDSRWKLIVSSEQELYDLQNDPGETRNVAADHQNIVRAMSAALSKVRPLGPGTAAVAPEAEDRLRALGYVSGSNAITSDDPDAPNPSRVIGAWTEFERALGQLREGRASDAIPMLARLVIDHPGSPVFQSTYGQAMRQSGNPKAAVKIYQAAVERWGRDLSLFHDLAVAAREAGDSDEAMRAEQAALALDGTNPMAQNGLGLLHADAGRTAGAASAFERAARGDSTNPSYWTNLGNARRALQDVGAAESAYRQALAVDLEFADALNGLGALYVQTSRAKEAVSMFERALRRDPQLHEARLNLGIAWQESGQVAKAAETYRLLLATAPASAKRERQAAAELLRGLR